MGGNEFITKILDNAHQSSEAQGSLMTISPSISIPCAHGRIGSCSKGDRLVCFLACSVWYGASVWGLCIRLMMFVDCYLGGLASSLTGIGRGEFIQALGLSKFESRTLWILQTHS